VTGPARLLRAGRGLLPRNPERPEPLRYPVAGVGIRLASVLAGLGVLAIPPAHDLIWTSLIVIGVLIAVASPDQAGAGLALGASIGSWFAAYGWDGTPPLAATAGFALALYLLHTSTALAAAVPLGVQLRAPVLYRWLRRCLVELAVAAVLAAASFALGRPDSSSALLLLGLVGVLVLVGIPVLLLHRSRS
jgi:hydrogenase/urease accessory protein HupE